MVTRPKQEHVYDQRQEALIATIAQQENYTWKDDVVDVASLPMTWNQVDDIRKVLSDWYVRRWDWSNWIIIQPSWSWWWSNLQQWDASWGIFPPHSAWVSWTWIISWAGTLPAPVGAVDLWDYLLWDWYNWTVIPNNADMYVNPWVSNVAVWWLPANSWPFNTTVRDMLDRILYPYEPLKDVHLALSLSESWYYEKWVNQAPVNLTASFVNSINPRHPVTDIVWKRDGSQINSESWADLSSPQVKTENNTIDDTTTFSIDVTDDSPNTLSDSATLHFVYPMYWWHSQADDYLNWTDLASIEAVLSEKIVRPKENTNITDSYNNARTVFIYPESYWLLTSILDDSDFETIWDYDTFTKDYTARDWQNVTYRIYQLKANASQTNFTNKFKF